MEGVGSILTFAEITVGVLALAPTLITAFEEFKVSPYDLGLFYVVMGADFIFVVVAAVVATFRSGFEGAAAVLAISSLAVTVGLFLLMRWTLHEQMGRFTAVP